jgi:hypothetical protein
MWGEQEMIPRRALLGIPALGGVAGLFAASTVADAAPADAAELTDRSLDPIVRAIDSLRGEVAREREFSEIKRIRDLQKEYLRVNAKLPDFIEVGTTVWFDVHDWHIRWQQPMSLARDAAGRYTIVLLHTVVILRTDLQPTDVGIPYDAR